MFPPTLGVVIVMRPWPFDHAASFMWRDQSLLPGRPLVTRRPKENPLILLVAPGKERRKCGRTGSSDSETSQESSDPG